MATWLRISFAAGVVGAVFGCSPSEPVPFYSGRFLVHSDYPESIRIRDWSGFGFASPSNGVIIPGTGKETLFEKLGRFPDSTVVTWMVEANSESHSQEIELRSVVPQNVEGCLNLTLDAEGVWHAEFSPKTD